MPLLNLVLGFLLFLAIIGVSILLYLDRKQREEHREEDVERAKGKERRANEKILAVAPPWVNSLDAMHRWYIQNIGSMMAKIQYSCKSSFARFQREFENAGFEWAEEPLWRDVPTDQERDGKKRNYVIRTTASRGGSTICFQFTLYLEKNEERGKPFLKLEGENRTSLGEEVEILEDVYAIFPSGDEETEIKSQEIHEAILASKIVYIDGRGPRKVPTLNHIRISKSGFAYLQEEKIEKYKNLLPYPDLNYAQVKVFYGNAKIAPMSKLIAYFQLMMEGKMHIAFSGPYGTGKTKLMQYLGALMSMKEDVKVFNLTTPVFRALIDPEVNLNAVFNGENKNIIVWDAAESALQDQELAAALSTWIDGNESERYNLRFMIAVRGKKENFRPDLFRPGRLTLFELGPLTNPEKIKEKMVHLIEKEMNQGMTFNTTRLNGLLKEDKKDEETGEVISPSGTILLADLYGCVQWDTDNLPNIPQVLEQVIEKEKSSTSHPHPQGQRVGNRVEQVPQGGHRGKKKNRKR